jgi:excisionase family DNA binding protein
MIDTVFAAMRTLAGEMQTEAAKRKAMTPTDPAAEASLYWAERLTLRVAELEADAEHVTPAQYASLHGVTEQTVRNWIRRGELAAEDTPRGYRIPRAAVRTPHLRAG